MSIGANIIEAKSSSSRKEFCRYYQIALRSANESKYWLCLLRDGFNVTKDVNSLLNEIIEISKILATSILTIRRK
ncbi:MAG: hypothetical protein CO073_00265 [Candidatus Komeilibacteria bacterium CG_4_9_14_0_8_um_filter_36_9]|uniref:Four helix bundle protein n=1 Tax=Candidatus Komeilibacteria bacterium CG_4_9_14_0_8_um_filter_36_9 TaxID=1974473 RepID=A0A2M8DSE3_9BACT|nr:MAG: hypothetical protein CO073_00265 [Candidatus Komeilibacteria bacterium CG_4_9_14_0_8_um_filter_36_9]